MKGKEVEVEETKAVWSHRYDPHSDRIVIDVARLNPEGETFEGESGEGLLDLGDDKFVKPEGGMRYDLFVSRTGREILVTGTVAQDLVCVCSRCGEKFETEVVGREFFRNYGVESGAFLDLTEEVREAIILSLPMFPVCHPECKGRCPSCGANLNEGDCGCSPCSGNAGLAAGLDEWIDKNSDLIGKERGK